MTQPTTYDEADEVLMAKGFWCKKLIEKKELPSDGETLRIEVYSSPIAIFEMIDSVRELLGEGWEVKKGNTDTIFVELKKDLTIST